MASAMDLEKEIFDDVEEIDEEILRMTADEISRRTRLLENEIRVLKDESTRLSLDLSGTKEKVKDNKEKIKFNKQLPYLVGNIVEILDANAEDEVSPSAISLDLSFFLSLSTPGPGPTERAEGSRGWATEGPRKESPFPLRPLPLARPLSFFLLFSSAGWQAEQTQKVRPFVRPTDSFRFVALRGAGGGRRERGP